VRLGFFPESVCWRDDTAWTSVSKVIRSFVDTVSDKRIGYIMTLSHSPNVNAVAVLEYFFFGLAT
jgi:hypothetical protein